MLAVAMVAIAMLENKWSPLYTPTKQTQQPPSTFGKMVLGEYFLLEHFTDKLLLQCDIISSGTFHFKKDLCRFCGPILRLSKISIAACMPFQDDRKMSSENKSTHTSTHDGICGGGGHKYRLIRWFEFLI